MKAFNDVLKGIGTSLGKGIPKLKSEDPLNKASGACDIVGAFTQVMLLMPNPYFKGIAMLFDSLSSLGSGVLSGLVTKPPGLTKSVVETVVEDVVSKLMFEQRNTELQSLMQGEQAEMGVRLRTLKQIQDSALENNHTLKPIHLAVLTGNYLGFIGDGVKLLARVWFYIERDSATKDSSHTTNWPCCASSCSHSFRLC